MSRKIIVRVPVEVVVRDRDVRLLVTLLDMGGKRRKPVKVSLSTLAESLESTLDTTRRAIKACSDEGYLVVQENYLENGTQLENTYRLTQQGLTLALAAQDSGVLAATA